MGLFHRRYLCICAFAFLLFAVLASFCTASLKLIVGAALLLISSALIVLAFVFKKKRFLFFVATVAVLLATVSVFMSYIFISVPEDKAKSYVGDRAVCVEILSCEYSTEYSSEYVVRVEQVGDDIADVKGMLYCDFASDFAYGDKLIVYANVSCSSNYDKSILLNLNVYDGYSIFHQDAENDSYFSIDGVRAIFNSLRNYFTDYIDSLYADESGIVKGFLISDKSDIVSKTISDFRRAGVSHLLAVSGLHVTLLLGALDLLLRKFRMPRKARCILVMFVGSLFLAMTGFSASSVRAVLMLFAVYVSFMIHEDSDAITSLFVAVSVIVLFSPHSIYDIGMWLSFFATLGILSVYPYFESIVSKLYKKRKSKILDTLLRIGVCILKTALITVVANFFILPIVWIFFGEISLVSVLTNLALSGIILIYLPMLAISLAVGAIPIFGGFVISVCSFLSKMILLIVSIFSEMHGAVISLEFAFSQILMVLFVISFSVLLVVNLKKKFWIALPPICFTVIFAICFGVFVITSEPKNITVTEKGNETYFVTEQGITANVYDVNDKSGFSYIHLLDGISPYITEIENYVIVTPSFRQAYNLRRLLSYVHIHKLRLPIPKDESEREKLQELYDVAREFNIEIEVYEKQKSLSS